MSQLNKAGPLSMGKVVTMKIKSGAINKDVSEAVQQRVLVVFEGHATSDE
jgi:hypothetical protein